MPEQVGVLRAEARAGNVDIFAATPPLCILQALLSIAATDLHRTGRVMKVLFLDVRRACFWAAATDWAFVELVGENKTDGLE